MSQRQHHHVFGPVPSRRLGRSLGVDLVPLKTCTYDCIYCQLGRTACKTVERREWVPVDTVLDELRRKLGCRPDYITLSGSGEPTLHSGLGEIIEAVHAMCDIPVAVLTNGSLLWDPAVRAGLAAADVVMPSLDAGDAPTFRAVNRPHRAIAFETMLAGLETFRRGFAGQYWLEVLLLAGHSAQPAQVRRIAAHVQRIGPDRVEINTASRPPADVSATPVARARLEELAELFTPRATVIAAYRHRRGAGAGLERDQGEILALLRRRPCTGDDLASSLGLRPVELAKHLEALETAGRIVSRTHGDRVFFAAS